MFEIRFILGAVLLSIASITDLRTREVPDWLSYGFIVLGVFINGLFSVMLQDISYVLFSIAMVGVTFAFMYVLWRLGVFGGGDVKLLTALSATIPFLSNIPSFLFVLFAGVLLSAPYFFTYLISKTDRAFWKNMLARDKKKIVNAVSFFILMYLGFSFNFWAGVFLFVIALIFSRYLHFLLPALVIVTVFVQEWYALLYSGVIVLFTMFFELVKHSGELLSKEVRLSNKLEGEILAYDVVRIRGKIVEISPFKHLLLKARGIPVEPLVLSKARGLTKQEIEKLKELGYKKVRIKESVPMVPIFLLGYLASPLFPSIIK